MLSSTSSSSSVEEGDVVYDLFDWKNLNQFFQLIQEIQRHSAWSENHELDKDFHLLMLSNLLQRLKDSYGSRGMECYEKLAQNSASTQLISSFLSKHNGSIPFEAMSGFLEIVYEPGNYLLPILKNDSMLFESLYLKSLRRNSCHHEHDDYLRKISGSCAIDRYRYFCFIKESINYQDSESVNELDTLFREFTLSILPSSLLKLSPSTHTESRIPEIDINRYSTDDFKVSEITYSTSEGEDDSSSSKVSPR